LEVVGVLISWAMLEIRRPRRPSFVLDDLSLNIRASVYHCPDNSVSKDPFVLSQGYVMTLSSDWDLKDFFVKRENAPFADAARTFLPASSDSGNPEGEASR